MRLPAVRLSLAALVLAACGGSAPPSSPAAQSSSPATNAATTCEGARLGEPGVIALKCDGTAVLNVTLSSLSKTVSGGTCVTSAGLFVVNAGVVTDHTFAGTRPDFVSVNTPPDGGGGQDTAASVLLNGKFYGDSGRFGGTVAMAPDHKSLHFTGSATTGETVTIDVTC